MERLTGKGAKSLKEAYAKVYSEQATPDYASMSDEEFAALVKKSGNPEGLIAKRKQQRIAAARENTRANYTAADAAADRERAKTEAENERRSARGEDPLPVPRGSQLKDSRPTAPVAKPPTDQEKVRAEYDRLRNSTDPKERAQAVTYGRQMAAAGASNRNFSGYQSASDAQKNLPAPAQRTSIADRLKAIRDIRSTSQPAAQPKTQPAAAQPKTQPSAAQPAAQPKVQSTAQPKVQPTTNPNQQSSLSSTVRSGTGGSVPASVTSRVLNTGSLKDKQDSMDIVNKRYASSLDQLATDMIIQKSGGTLSPERRARLDAMRQRRLQNASPALRSTLKDIENRRLGSRRQASGQLRDPMRVTTGSGSNATTTTYAAGTPKSDPNLAAEIKTTKNLINKGSGIPTGNTVQTKMNPDSSLRVTQRRTPAATAKIKQSLDIQSADLFDIIQGEFIEEGYTHEDTVYMMANLNEEQLQEFLKYLVQPVINAGKRGLRGAINRVGAMFNRAPKQMPSGQVGALRLYQDKARQSVNRLNQSTAASRIKDATTKPTTRNLDPRAVSDRNAREAASQIRQRNIELGRPSWYNPNNPGSKEALKRHYADKRSGVRGLPD